MRYRTTGLPWQVFLVWVGVGGRAEWDRPAGAGAQLAVEHRDSRLGEEAPRGLAPLFLFGRQVLDMGPQVGADGGEQQRLVEAIQRIQVIGPRQIAAGGGSP